MTVNHVQGRTSSASILGNAIRVADSVQQGPMVQTATPVPVSAPPEAQAKADVKSTGLLEIVKKPEAWGPLGE